MNCLISRLSRQCPYERICHKERQLQALQQKEKKLKNKKALLRSSIDTGDRRSLLETRQSYETGLMSYEEVSCVQRQITSIGAKKPISWPCLYEGKCKQKAEILDLRLRALRRRCFEIASSYNKICTLINAWSDYERTQTAQKGKVYFVLEEKQEEQLLSCYVPQAMNKLHTICQIQSFKLLEDQQLLRYEFELHIMHKASADQIKDKTAVIRLDLEVKNENKVPIEEILFVMESIAKLMTAIKEKNSLKAEICVPLSRICYEKGQLHKQIRRQLQFKIIGKMQPDGRYVEDQLLVRRIYDQSSPKF